MQIYGWKSLCVSLWECFRKRLEIRPSIDRLSQEDCPHSIHKGQRQSKINEENGMLPCPDWKITSIFLAVLEFQTLRSSVYLLLLSLWTILLTFLGLQFVDSNQESQGFSCFTSLWTTPCSICLCVFINTNMHIAVWYACMSEYMHVYVYTYIFTQLSYWYSLDYRTLTFVDRVRRTLENF